MNETSLEHNQIQLTSKHRLKIDKLNYTISTKYQKREGRGKSADFIDEYGYNDDKHYGNPLAMCKRLLESEFRENLTDKEIIKIDELIQAIEKSYHHIDKVAEDLKNHINEHITIDLGEPTGRGRKKLVKGIEISEDE